mgnify:CR=1 FL=1
MAEKLYRFAKFLFFVAFVSLAFSCANIVSPTGGPKDIAPPKVKTTEPQNYSAGFTGNKIRITFNEYVVLEDQANQIVVSPPTVEEVEYNISGKSIVIDLPEKISDSVTYSINFGESIKDLNEGNPLRNYEFVFSKGNTVDSLSIQGRVYDALLCDPQKGVLVMLYPADDDSLPIKSQPLYVAKTNNDGNFVIGNIKKQKYKIFALRDMNTDMLFNQPAESIAFADSMLTPQYIVKNTDTAKIKADSSALAKDSLLPVEPIRNTILYLFTQKDTSQKLLKARADTYRQCKFVFKNPVKDLQIIVTNRQLPENWSVNEYSVGRDTLTCWLKDPDMDTLKMIFKDKGIIFDSAELALKQKPSDQQIFKKPSGKGVVDDDWRKNKVMANVSGAGSLPYYMPVRLRLSNPSEKTDFTKIRLAEKVDSTFKEINPDAIAADTSSKRLFYITYKWVPEKLYRLEVLPGAFTDIYGLANDSLMANFSANSPEHYGRLLFTLKLNESGISYIVQLLKEDKSFIEQHSAKANGQMVFENLAPANYRIRIIKDENNNGLWDEGDYFQKRQPEPVFYFPQVITIRANWDTEYEFVL